MIDSACRQISFFIFYEKKKEKEQGENDRKRRRKKNSTRVTNCRVRSIPAIKREDQKFNRFGSIVVAAIREIPLPSLLLPRKILQR